MANLMELDKPPNLLDMFINSTDILLHKEINQTMPPTWNDRPPLLKIHHHHGPQNNNNNPNWLKRFAGGNNQRDPEYEDPNLLKGMVRKGIPPPLRCAVWISNIIQSCHPHQELSKSHAYRTLAKVQALDHGYESIWNSDTTSRADVKQLEFGNTTQFVLLALHENANTKVLKEILWALSHTTLLEYAPLVPTLAALLMRFQSESYVFCSLREMAGNAYFYFPTTKCESVAYEKAFMDILEKLHPSTCHALQQRPPPTTQQSEQQQQGIVAAAAASSSSGSKDEEDKQDNDSSSPSLPDMYTKAIFHDFFQTLLKEEDVFRIMDIYTLEGSKVLFRFGVALIVLFHKEYKEIDTKEEFWNLLTRYCQSELNFEILVKKAYGVHGKGVRKRFRFPRRPILQRIIQLEEERYWKEKSNSSGGTNIGSFQQDGDNNNNSNDRQGNNDNDDDDENIFDMIQPLGLVPAKEPSDPLRQEKVLPILAETSYVRTKLAEWLPLSLRFTKLDLIFSTNHHGRTLDQFYKHVHNAKHTITLVEPLLPEQDDNNNNNLVVGMYASQTWHASTRVYGDGACCLFRLVLPDDKQEDNNDTAKDDAKEDPSQCWKWNPKQLLEEVSMEEEDLHGTMNANNNKTALLEQFQVGTRDYISMGGNSDGSAGLRLNEDLTRAESSPADGFDNLPLAGKEFEVGLVEVYQIVRQIDGVGIR